MTGMLSCGRPCPGVDVQVVDESGKRVENGHHGELVARGAKCYAGLLEQSEETALAFS